LVKPGGIETSTKNVVAQFQGIILGIRPIKPNNLSQNYFVLNATDIWYGSNRWPIGRHGRQEGVGLRSSSLPGSEVLFHPCPGFLRRYLANDHYCRQVGSEGFLIIIPYVLNC